MSTVIEKEIEKCIDELKWIREQEHTVLDRLRMKGVTTDEQIADVTARVEQQRIARRKEPWCELLKREMREVVEKQWVSRVSGDYYSEYGGLLESTLEKIGWFDRRIRSAEFLVLFRVNVENTEKYRDDENPEVVSCITPYFSVEEEEGKPSVNWEQFQPCDGEVAFKINTRWQ
jgi:hypothetical protein